MFDLHCSDWFKCQSQAFSHLSSERRKFHVLNLNMTPKQSRCEMKLNTLILKLEAANTPTPTPTPPPPHTHTHTHTHPPPHTHTHPHTPPPPPTHTHKHTRATVYLEELETSCFQWLKCRNKLSAYSQSAHSSMCKSNFEVLSDSTVIRHILLFQAAYLNVSSNIFEVNKIRRWHL